MFGKRRKMDRMSEVVQLQKEFFDLLGAYEKAHSELRYLQANIPEDSRRRQLAWAKKLPPLYVKIRDISREMIEKCKVLNQRMSEMGLPPVADISSMERDLKNIEVFIGSYQG